MKALILFRSHYGNTKQIAEAMAKELGAHGVETIVSDLRRRLPDLGGIDLVLVGAPTRMARVTRRALRVLKRLRKRGFIQKPVAIFDTYGPIPTKPEELEKGKKWLYPGAAGIMHTAAKNLGLNVYSETGRFEVSGMKGPLKDHELEKAAAFAEALLSVTGKKPA
jgi:flavodoxin